jgi:hypothetical protein
LSILLLVAIIQSIFVAGIDSTGCATYVLSFCNTNGREAFWCFGITFFLFFNYLVDYQPLSNIDLCPKGLCIFEPSSCLNFFALRAKFARLTNVGL